MFPWAKFRRAKGGVKIHVMLDHDDYMPAYVHVTEAKLHEVNVARLLNLNPGSIVAMDRAYLDFALLGRWTEQGVFFVTRLKSNTAYNVVKELTTPKYRNILSDQIIELYQPKAAENCPHFLRRIVVWDPNGEREIVLLSNHLDFGASTIASIYKDRWEIEVFFKTLKQNLKVKTFIGTSQNALLIQIWTAIIALLLLKWLHHLSKAGWSLSNVAAMLRWNLFTYQKFIDWLHEPFQTPPDVPKQHQPSLPLSFLGHLDEIKTVNLFSKYGGGSH